MLELGERGIEEAGVMLPFRVPGQGHQRRIGGRHHSRKEACGVVGGHGVGGARSKSGREEDGCGERRDFCEVTHIYSRPGELATAPASARLRNIA